MELKENHLWLSYDLIDGNFINLIQRTKCVDQKTELGETIIIEEKT